MTSVNGYGMVLTLKIKRVTMINDLNFSISIAHCAAAAAAAEWPAALEGIR